MSVEAICPVRITKTPSSHSSHHCHTCGQDGFLTLLGVNVVGGDTNAVANSNLLVHIGHRDEVMKVAWNDGFLLNNCPVWNGEEVYVSWSMDGAAPVAVYGMVTPTPLSSSVA